MSVVEREVVKKVNVYGCDTCHTETSKTSWGLPSGWLILTITHPPSDPAFPTNEMRHFCSWVCLDRTVRP